MPDLSNLDLAKAFGQSGCPLCRVLAGGERRDIASFAREGRFAPQAQGRFRRAGGYCRRHAWLLHAARRLAELADDLAKFDRKRDYCYRDEPKGKEQDSWTRTVALYGGEPDRS